MREFGLLFSFFFLLLSVGSRGQQLLDGFLFNQSEFQHLHE